MSVYYETLKDRDLWLDGESSLHVDVLCDRLFSGEDIGTILHEELISERDQKNVQRFLKLVPSLKDTDVSYKKKSSINSFDTSFNIDEKYKTLNISKLLTRELRKEIDKKNLTDDEALLRIDRIQEELELFKHHGLYDVLNACVFIVDTLRKNKIVWGPGRGSACCSYVLYLVGIHDIDSVEFDLEMNEFLR